MVLTKQTAYYSSVIKAPVAAVWDKLKSYNGMPGWHPAVAESNIIEGVDNQIGAIRHMKTHGGGEIWERLVAMDASKKLITYEFCMGGSEPYTQSKTGFGFEVENYIATISLLPITAGDQTLFVWEGSWDGDAESKEEMVNTFQNGIYKSGEEHVAAMFA